MNFLSILFTVLAALFFGIIFYYVFKASGPWGNFWTFLLVLILGGLAASAWIIPFGPVYREVSWLPILLIVLFFSLLLAAATPPYGRSVYYRERENPNSDPRVRKPSGVAAAFGVFFFLLILFLLVAAIMGIFS